MSSFITALRIYDNFSKEFPACFVLFIHQQCPLPAAPELANSIEVMQEQFTLAQKAAPYLLVAPRFKS